MKDKDICQLLRTSLVQLSVLVDSHLSGSETGQTGEAYVRSARYCVLELRTCTRNCKGHAKVGINSQFFFSKFQPEWKRGVCRPCILSEIAQSRANIEQNIRGVM